MCYLLLPPITSNYLLSVVVPAPNRSGSGLRAQVVLFWIKLNSPE